MCPYQDEFVEIRSLNRFVVISIANGEADDDQDDICEGCVTGKSSVKSFPKSTYGEVKNTSLLKVVHSDVI